MSGTREPRRASRCRHAIAVVLAVLAVGCAEPPWAVDDGTVRLTSPPCDDDAACAEAYEFEGRLYVISDSDLTDADVADLEAGRLGVSDPAGIDDLVTTADPTVIYLSTEAGWLEGRTNN